MEKQKEVCQLLDMMLRPAFWVRDGRIAKINGEAQGLLLQEGAAISDMLLTGQEEYAALGDGCLYLQLALPGGARGAAVSSLGDGALFLPDPDTEDPALQALALASRELREPLNDLIAISGTLLPQATAMEDPKVRHLLASMSKGLYQMQRVLGNMSDAGQSAELSCQEIRNITQVFADIFEKASAYLAHLGIALDYSGPRKDILGLIDQQQMERAVLNILSNAARFMPDGGCIAASLTQTGSTLRLTIQDPGSGIADEILTSLFTRYLRQPALEDRRHGLGLGMVLIRSAALSHGGTLLVHRCQGSGTRITMTMKLRQSCQTRVCCVKTSLTGGRDPTLIELSGLLPTSVYEEEL